MSWIVWLPHAASVLALLLVVANTNLGRPVDPDRSLLFPAAVFLVGSTLWYTVFLLLARWTPAWQLLGTPPGRAAGVGAVTIAFVLLLGMTEKSGSFLALNLQDVLVMFPGINVVGAADSVRLVSQLPDARRCDPRAWSSRHRKGESRTVRWAGFPGDGRVLLLVEVEVEGGLFADRVEWALVALRPDGSLDEAFAERLHAPLAGWVTLQGGRLVVLRGGRVAALLSTDGSAQPGEERDRFAAALDAFGGQDAFLTGEPGAYAVMRPRGNETEVALFDLAAAQARLVARAVVERADRWRWREYLADGDGMLVGSGKVARHGPDGAVDPSFHFQLPPRLAGLKDDLELRDLVRSGGRALVLLHGKDHEYLAFLRPDGAVEADPLLALKVHDERRFGHTSRIVALQDGRLAVVLSVEGSHVLVLVRPGAAGELRPLAEDHRAQGVRTTDAGTVLRLAGEVIEVGARGEVLVRDASGRLSLRDLARGGERRSQAPEWIEHGRR